MKPGRYLTKYHGHVLSQGSIQYWCGLHAEENGEVELKFATTPDEIEAVYINGPHSCMAHDADGFSSPGHPTRVYGAGDLGIAYGTRRNKIVARTVCWPARKIFYSVIYGDKNAITPALERAGFSREYSSAFQGARLLRIPYENGFVCPYLDCGSSVTDGGEYLTIGGDLVAQETDGLTRGAFGTPCDRCEEPHDEESLTYLESEEQTWCNDCIHRYMTRCRYCAEYHRDTEFREVTWGGRSRYVCAGCAEENFTACSVCGRFHDDDCAHCADCSPCAECLPKPEDEEVPIGLEGGTIDDPSQEEMPIAA
jgi:hypothetical protein